ncbi:Endo-1,4-beta-xylanase Z precursor [Labilithrix luteola]|uniref:Endo-1,4-beta-xylanase Z n=1 Tax=Labilithrix luteola TaxID=1391654 RepID=A0A0K1PJW8_9BACT|nr:hypothetical protein [Labilithrix luteola]AKU93701.1 Endo-1,4-beta-xylanase Z precursor [Labilithrix luteola]
MRTRSCSGELEIRATLFTLLAFGALGVACTGDISGDDTTAVDEAGALPDASAPNGDASAPKDATTDAAADGPPPGPVSPTYEDFEVNHFLLTGQSNAVANGGDPPLTTAPLEGYSNLMFDTGVMPMKSCDGNGCRAYDTPTSFVPLVDGDDFFGYAVETAASSIGYGISHLAKARYEFGTRAGYPSKHDMLVSVHGRSGNTYWCLRKGFCTYNADSGYLSPFAQAMSEVESAKGLAAASGRSYVVRAVGAIHGESDHYAYVFGTSEFPLPGTDGTPGKVKDYADALVEWQQDLDASIKAITGQKQNVPLLVSGLSGWTTVRESKLAQMQLDAHVRAPEKVIYVTPAYPMEVREDCLHYSNAGQRHLGEYFAKVYGRVVLGGQSWEPVRPKSISRAGNVVTVVYYVPVPPLVVDTKLVSAAESYGFDFWDNGNRVGIASVAVSGPDTVTITLNAAPSGTNMRLTYAQNQPLNDQGGSAGCIGNGLAYAGGARGNLRDSDDTPSLFGNDLSNWGVNFEAAVP